MRYRELGSTGLKVSCIALGTVELGMDYGIGPLGSNNKPDKTRVKYIIDTALERGINLFDTAPDYGESEELIGSFIGSRPCYIATKVNVGRDEKDISKYVRNSVERSLNRLKRDSLDIVQIHNVTVDVIKRCDISKVLVKLREEGLIRFLGATLHKPEEAMAAIEAGCFDLLQVPYNILDQRISKGVMPEAKRQGMGILSRSAYFKGVLTKKVESLGQEYEFLKNAAKRIKTEMGLKSWNSLSKLALRFCISTEGIHSTLVGTKSLEHLESILEAEKEAPLPDDIFRRLLNLGLDDTHWFDPRNWTVG